MYLTQDLCNYTELKGKNSEHLSKQGSVGGWRKPRTRSYFILKSRLYNVRNIKWFLLTEISITLIFHTAQDLVCWPYFVVVCQRPCP